MSLKVHAPRFLTPVHTRIGFLPNKPKFFGTSFLRRHATSRSFLPHPLHASPAVVSAVTAEQPPEPPVRMLAVVGHGAVSPLKSALWQEVMLHTVK